VKFRPDPSFRYTPSHNTDLRKTFARIRESLREEPGKAVDTPARVTSDLSWTGQAGRPAQRESNELKQ